MHFKYKQFLEILVGLFSLILILVLARYMLIKDISFTITSDSYNYLKTAFLIVLLILASTTIYLNFMIFYINFNVIHREIKEMFIAINIEFQNIQTLLLKKLKLKKFHSM